VNSFLSKNQINQINVILKSHNNVLDFSSISKISKPFSMLTFIIKEIIDFNTKTTKKGILLSNLRKQKILIFKYLKDKEKINKLIQDLK